jgi:hypothetical protein
MTDLERRLRKLEDRVAIQDLVVRYFLAADGDDLEGVGASFTEEACFSSSGHANATGRAGIMAFIGTARTHMGLTLHTPHYTDITFLSDDEAIGLVGAHLEMVLAGQPLYGAVRYVDRYVRTGDRWLIAERDMRTIFMSNWTESAAALTSNTPVRWPGTDPTPSDYPRR